MIRVNPNFPVYLFKDFLVLDKEKREILVDVVLENKKRNHNGYGGSFLIDNDYDNFFKNLYDLYFKKCIEIFRTFNIREDNSRTCWSYSSNKYDCGPGRIHNHISTSTINSVYYLNIPPGVTEEKGSITFFLNGNKMNYKPCNYDLLIFPNYLDHKINNYKDDEEYRVSINMEIKCLESSDLLFKRLK